MQRGSVHFGLAEPYVAEYEPVHRCRTLHVVLHVGDSRELVRRLLIGKRCLELALPCRIWSRRPAFDAGPFTVQGDDLLGHHSNGFADLVLRGFPIGATHTRQSWRLATAVGTNRSQLVGGDVEPILAVISDQQIVTFDTSHLTMDQAFESSDAVLAMNYEIARFEIAIAIGDIGRRLWSGNSMGPLAARNLLLAYNAEAQARRDEPAVYPGRDDGRSGRVYLSNDGQA